MITNGASTALRQPIENFMMIRQRGIVVCLKCSIRDLNNMIQMKCTIAAASEREDRHVSLK